jgi:hypothetical protein
MNTRVQTFALIAALLCLAHACRLEEDDVKGRYIACENPNHVIELKGNEKWKGSYLYLVHGDTVNQGTWEFREGKREQICFHNWKDQGLYRSQLDTMPYVYFVMLNGGKLEFHPDLYEDDFMKE